MKKNTSHDIFSCLGDKLLNSLDDISLTYGPADAPSFISRVLRLHFELSDAIVEEKCGAKGDFAIDAVKSLNALHKPYKKRDILDRELRNQFPDVTFSNKFFDFIDIWNDIAIEMPGMNNQNSYNLRSFALDIEKSVLRTDISGKNVIIKAGEYDQKRRKLFGYWYKRDISELLIRFIFIREHNIVRARGWGQCLNKYKKILGLGNDDDDLEDRPNVIAVECTRELIRKKIYREEKKRIVWEREEIFTWKCPITGILRKMNKKDMKYWRWKKGG